MLQGRWNRRNQRVAAGEMQWAGDVDGLSGLVPVRYGRTLQPSLAFCRGSASIMADGLAALHNTRLHVQPYGNCPLMDAGVFATPERRVVFDINGFDETSRGHPEGVARLPRDAAVMQAAVRLLRCRTTNFG